MYVNQLHYEVFGAGKPVLIIHGLGGNIDFMTDCMEPVFKKIEGYQRIYVDLPGMGKSKFDNSYATSDCILDTLVNFINETIHIPFVLIGQSYGGYLARGILSRMPHQVEAMMLLCPVIVANRDKRNVPLQKECVVDEDFLQKHQQSDISSYLEYAVIINDETFQHFTNATHTAFEQSDQSSLDVLSKHYDYTFDVDKAIKSLNLNVPVYMICGRQDICVGYHDQWKVINEYKNGSFSLVNKAGHNLQIDQPILFDSLAYSWLTYIIKTQC